MPDDLLENRSPCVLDYNVSELRPVFVKLNDCESRNVIPLFNQYREIFRTVRLKIFVLLIYAKTGTRFTVSMILTFITFLEIFMFHKKICANNDIPISNNVINLQVLSHSFSELRDNCTK